MKQASVIFASVLSILAGVLFIYTHLNWADQLEGQLYIGLGAVLLAAGITGLWMKGRILRR
jgi:hypothetical protein